MIIINYQKHLGAMYPYRHTFMLGERNTRVNLKPHIVMANVLLHRFDAAHENTMLTLEERWMWRTLKHTILDLSSMDPLSCCCQWAAHKELYTGN
jgi:hypothetical protein